MKNKKISTNSSGGGGGGGGFRDDFGATLVQLQGCSHELLNKNKCCLSALVPGLARAHSRFTPASGGGGENTRGSRAER